MYKKRANKAVTEVVGTALLLGMAIALFSLLQIITFGLPFNPTPPSARLVGTVNETTIFIGHYGGEALSPETEIIFRIDGSDTPEKVGDLKPDLGRWNIGETVSLYYGDLSGKSVEVIVVDSESNSVIMMSKLQ